MAGGIVSYTRKLVGWIGLSEEKATHGHLCVKHVTALCSHSNICFLPRFACSLNGQHLRANAAAAYNNNIIINNKQICIGP